MSSKENCPQVGPGNRESHPASAGCSFRSGGSTATLHQPTYLVEAQARKSGITTGKRADSATEVEHDKDYHKKGIEERGRIS